MDDWKARLRDIAALGGAALVGSAWGCGSVQGVQSGDGGIHPAPDGGISPPACNADPDPCCGDPLGAACAVEKQCANAPTPACCAMWGMDLEANYGCSMLCNANPDPCCSRTGGPQDPPACEMSQQQCAAMPTLECCTALQSDGIAIVACEPSDGGTSAPCGANPDPCCIDAGGASCAAAMQCGNAPTPACCAMWGMSPEASFDCSMLCNANPDPCCPVAGGPQNPQDCVMSQQQCAVMPTMECCTTLRSDGIAVVACEPPDGGAREGGPDAAGDGGTDALADAISGDAKPDGD